MSRVLEVDVNGGELFFVDKDVLARFSGRIKKLSVAASARRPPRVVLHGFPGGADAFELVARFCYTGGGGGGCGVEVTAANACAVRCAAEFLDMAADAPTTAPSLVSLAEKALEEMPHWPWQSVVDAVKQCQRLLPLSDSTGVFDRAVAALVSHMAVPQAGDATPTSSSPESSAFRFSCDTKSSCLSLRGSTGRTWWFEDLVVLSPGTVERVAAALVARGTDHGVVSRFLFYYLKCRLAGGASADDKKAMLEATIAAMAGLDRSAVSCKGLFGILRISAPLRLSDASQERLVAMIGRKLDHATLDNLLVPAPSGTGSLYDVSLVLRFLEAFLRGGARDGEPARLKKVGRLMDLYLAEVAPDPSLRPARFVELATALPAPARDCHDALYRAIDVYFQVHGRLTDEEKMKICKGLSYEKLSPECCKHLARNAGFPTRAAVQALASQHTALRSLVLRRDSGQLKPVSPPPAAIMGKHRHGYDDDGGENDGQVILYARRLDLSLENQNLRSLLDGMHWRVMELEKVCSRMKTQMTKMKASRRGGSCTTRSLPRMCS
ncbi:hypothetical protein ACP70R_005688 [Stipagrostis hirtigluma subsp. patula]